MNILKPDEATRRAADRLAANSSASNDWKIVLSWIESERNKSSAHNDIQRDEIFLRQGQGAVQALNMILLLKTKCG